MAVARARLKPDRAGVAGRTLEQDVRAEYTAMPGLSVTLAQAQRLWAVDRQSCAALFSRLVGRGVLRRTAAGRFVLAARGRALIAGCDDDPQKMERR